MAREIIMNRVMLALLVTLAADAAFAQSRPSTPSRTCSANRQSVAVNGAIVLGTGGFTYDRFVRNRSFCQLGEFAEPAFVPSRDTPSCLIGYRCKSDSPYWDD